MREGAHFDVERAARTLVVPTLVLCGSRDRHNLPLSRALADILPNARLELIEGAGHVANLDQPGRFTQALERFLA
jgi:pimeloyl-ACP methyl ester carboxylesterase